MVLCVSVKVLQQPCIVAAVTYTRASSVAGGDQNRVLLTHVALHLEGEFGLGGRLLSFVRHFKGVSFVDKVTRLLFESMRSLAV